MGVARKEIPKTKWSQGRTDRAEVLLHPTDPQQARVTRAKRPNQPNSGLDWAPGPTIPRPPEGLTEVDKLTGSEDRRIRVRSRHERCRGVPRSVVVRG